MGSSYILVSGKEKQEDMIEIILKRLGVQKSVLFVRDIVMMSIYCAITSFIALIIIWGSSLRTNISFGVFALFVFMHQV